MPPMPSPSAPTPTSIAASSPAPRAEQVRDKLTALVADPEIKVTLADKRSEVIKVPPPLTPQIMEPVESVAAKIWPGTPIVPLMSAGATDGAFLTPAGIPTYGLSGMFGDPDGNGRAWAERTHTREFGL